jgi:mannose-6-phosphate isomerase-like protein (cupin superfamily)
MKVHDVQAILAAVGQVGEVKTAEEDAAAFPQLATYDGGGVYVGRFAGEGGPWELHPDADELLHVLDGELEVTVLTGDRTDTVTVKPGCFVVVPRGHWHHVAGRPSVALLAVSPRTEVSFDDPRKPSA